MHFRIVHPPIADTMPPSTQGGTAVHLIRNLAIMAGLVLSLAACATQSYYTSENLRRESRQPRILMMPPDVELYEVTAGGGLELNAEWTRQGQSNLTGAVRKNLNSLNAQFLEFTPPAEESDAADRLNQLQKLHGTVGSTIGRYHFAQNNRLPTKKGAFDWTLGPGAQELGTYADADYALFVWVRDSYSSPGRAVVKAAAAVLFGVYIPGGIQFGHASLVDLRTGQVVWFNALNPREAGDLRTPEPAADTVAQLLDKLPK